MVPVFCGSSLARTSRFMVFIQRRIGVVHGWLNASLALRSGLSEACPDVSGTSMMDKVGSLTCFSLLETHLGILTLSGFNLMTLRFSLTSSGIEMAHVCGAILFLQCSAFAQMSRNFGTILHLTSCKRSIFMTCRQGASISATWLLRLLRYVGAACDAWLQVACIAGSIGHFHATPSHLFSF